MEAPRASADRMFPVECWIANLWEFRNGKLVSMIDIFDSAKAAVAATP